MERRNNRITRDNPKFHSSRIVIVLKVEKEGEKKRFSSEFFQDRTRIVKKKKKKKNVELEINRRVYLLTT